MREATEEEIQEVERRLAKRRKEMGLKDLEDPGEQDD
jgi:hypothetical protein